METDEYLKAGSKLGNEEQEEAMERLISLLSFVNGKDVFEAFYKKHLAKRLLLDRSSSQEAEKLMISKLKPECGAQFTNKLEGMFKDLSTSENLTSEFKQLKKVPILFKIHVLTTGYWPSYKEFSIQVPSYFLEYQEAFRQFYMEKHEGRKLIWQYSLSMCVLNGFFTKGKKILSVSMFQTLVLLLFNEHQKLTFPQIQELTKLGFPFFQSSIFSFLLSQFFFPTENAELKRTLKSLSCGKVRVLRKSTKTKEIEEDDVFQFRSDFTDKRVKIKINTIQVRETVEENNETWERLLQDRLYQIDAAIVRIMKMRKTLSHSQLVSELFNQLKFPIQPAQIKQRIESLIDREYLERDENKSQFYNYLA